MNKFRIAVPSNSSDGLNALVTTRFGRCAFFTIITLDDDKIIETKVVPNNGIQALGGAGPMAAQIIAQNGASIVIGGNYGPNAANALKQGGIKTLGYPQSNNNVTVGEIIELYKNEQLEEINGPNVASHTGMGGVRGKGPFS